MAVCSERSRQGFSLNVRREEGFLFSSFSSQFPFTSLSDQSLLLFFGLFLMHSIPSAVEAPELTRRRECSLPWEFRRKREKYMELDDHTRQLQYVENRILGRTHFCVSNSPKFLSLIKRETLAISEGPLLRNHHADTPQTFLVHFFPAAAAAAAAASIRSGGDATAGQQSVGGDFFCPRMPPLCPPRPNPKKTEKKPQKKPLFVQKQT